MNFLKSGDAGRSFEEEKQRQKDQAEQGNAREWRFKLSHSSTGYIVFLDDLDNFLLEHQYARPNEKQIIIIMRLALGM